MLLSSFAATFPTKAPTETALCAALRNIEKKYKLVGCALKKDVQEWAMMQAGCLRSLLAQARKLKHKAGGASKSKMVQQIKDLLIIIPSGTIDIDSDSEGEPQASQACVWKCWWLFDTVLIVFPLMRLNLNTCIYDCPFMNMAVFVHNNVPLLLVGRFPRLRHLKLMPCS